MHRMVGILIIPLTIMINCCSERRSIYKDDEVIYRGRFRSIENDTIPYSITRQNNIIHDSASVKLNLRQPLPNPFSPDASIHFYVPYKNDSVRIEIGKDSISYKLIYSGVQPKGDYRLTPVWGTRQNEIIYIRITIGQTSSIKKCLLMR
jgi:hypothetical protein